MSDEIVPAVPANVSDQSLASVQVYDRIQNPMEAVKQLGAAIFKSGLFGVDRMEQGEILAMQCLVEKKSPLELARTYHFIQGQLAIRADALLAKYQQAGGFVVWTERTDEKVEATFHYKERSAVIKATLKEYTDNGTALGKDGKLKDNWKRWPRRMLTARAISEGVRLLAPECCFGTYVAEEIDRVEYVKPRKASAATTLAELVPADKVARACELLNVKTLDDVPADIAQMICNKPAPFIESLNA